MNHWCAVLRCFSQLGMWGDERYSAVNRIKTTDVDLPKMIRKRIKEFPSVLFYLMLAATLAPSWYSVGPTSALLFMLSCTFFYHTQYKVEKLQYHFSSGTLEVIMVFAFSS